MSEVKKEKSGRRSLTDDDVRSDQSRSGVVEDP